MQIRAIHTRTNEISGYLPEHCPSVFGSVPDWHQWGPLVTGSQPQFHPTMTADQRVFHCKKIMKYQYLYF